MRLEETIILGIISSIIASIVFYLIMIFIKPRFIISDKIGCTKVDNEYVDYVIKIVNTTHAYITNIDYSLLYCIESDDGVVEIKIVEPLKTPLKNLDKYTKKNTDYAYRITYRIKKEDYPLNENTYFEFTFQANHSFSNAMKIKKSIYRKGSIMSGIFETGKSVKVLNC